MFFDLHNDLLTASLTKRQKDSYLTLNSEVKIILAYFSTKQASPLKRISNAFEKLKQCKNLLFAIEDLHFATFENLDQILSLPISYATLAWSGDNAVAGGHNGGGGISFLGREIIQRFNEKGISVDTAHLNKKSFYQVISYSKKVFNSHTCLDSIFSHSRNLTDEQVRILIEKKGIIGLTPVSSFMSNFPTLKADFIKQIDTFCSKFGYQNLAIGTDFFGTEPLPDLKSYNDFSILRTDLYKLGYTNQIVNDIFYNNANDFFATKGA